MTNQVAITMLKNLEQSLDDYCELNDEGKEAFHMAITALELFGNSEQLPSVQPEFSNNSKELEKNSKELENKNGELISRQAIIAEFACCELTPDGGIDVNYALDFIKALPSAQPRKGKWTRREDGMLPIICECSVCGFDTTNFELFSFCPICGSRMGEGEQE